MACCDMVFSWSEHHVTWAVWVLRWCRYFLTSSNESYAV